MIHENGVDNLYTRIYRLLATEQYVDAERVLDEHLSRDPFSGEAILSWTELKLAQKQPDTAIKRLAPLAFAFPTDPYYMLAIAEIVLQEAYVTTTDVTELLDRVAKSAGDSADVFAKVGFAAAMRGFWSYGMRFFVKALRAKERLNIFDSQDLILLWGVNEASLDTYLCSLVALDGRGGDGDSLDDVPLEILVRTICILLLATTEAGIAEAWPVAVRLACKHPEISEAWTRRNLVPLFSRFCFDWIGIESLNGGRIGRWSTN